MKEHDIIRRLRELIEEIKSMTEPAALLELLKQHLELSSEHLLIACAVVRRLDELGIEARVELRKFCDLPYLRLINDGQLLPDLYRQLHDKRPKLLSKLADLPLTDQQRLFADGFVLVWSRDGSNRQVPLEALTDKEIKRVFGKRQIRDEAEQVGRAIEEYDTERTNAEAIELAEIKYFKRDKPKKVLFPKATIVTKEQLQRILRELG